MTGRRLTVDDVLGPGGLLASTLEGFEFRPSQLQMARLIQEALDEMRPVIVEAGTGTGKTLGYLVPIVLSGKKAVISTGTKNLQEQVFHKDIPLLERCTGLRAEAALMKGRKNYLCLHRYHQFFSQPSFIRPDMEVLKRRLESWLARTGTGDRSEIEWLGDEEALWDAVSCTSEQCLGPECVFQEDCFINALRRRAAEAKVVIVNHHLFFADLKVKRDGFGEIIPRFQVVVFDEAHEVEETATTYFGESFGTGQVMELVGDLEREIRHLTGEGVKRTRGRLDAVRKAALDLADRFREGPEKGRLDPETLTGIREEEARRIGAHLSSLVEDSGLERAESHEIRALLARAADLAHLLESVLSAPGPDWLTWYERGKKGVRIHTCPLDVSGPLNEYLYDKVKMVGLTSATLSTQGNFHYVRSRLGLPEESAEGIFPSHFDYREQALLYIPEDLPEPSSPRFPQAAGTRILAILKRSRGRALVLFTSYRNLDAVHGLIRDRLPFTVLRQGEAPRTALLEAFREDVHSVLLATGSFWQGVDVPGEALSCLVIDKLPFDSPGDPVVAAKIEALRQKGQNPFTAYQVPSAIISLKQGLGRLIRKGSDRGLLAILDRRILSRPYGRFFLESLPRVPVTARLSDVSTFFGKPGGGEDEDAPGRGTRGMHGSPPPGRAQ